MSPNNNWISTKETVMVHDLFCLFIYVSFLGRACYWIMLPRRPVKHRLGQLCISGR